MWIIRFQTHTQTNQEDIMSKSDYNERVNNILREHIAGDDQRGRFRLILIHTPLRTKHEKWQVAVERYTGRRRGWVRAVDWGFDSEEAAAAEFDSRVAVWIEGAARVADKEDIAQASCDSCQDDVSIDCHDCEQHQAAGI